jgi:hypothetical protein
VGHRRQRLRRSLRGPVGGSHALAELLDDFAEEIYISLLDHYKFDLIEWFDGKRKSSPAIILTMLRHLPEGSLYSATLSAKYELRMKELKARKDAGEDVELPEESEPSELERLIQEKRSWTLLPSLLAEGLNRDRALVWAQFDKENRPELPVWGPEAWWPESQKKHQKPAAEKKGPSLLERHFGKLAAHG